MLIFNNLYWRALMRPEIGLSLLKKAALKLTYEAVSLKTKLIETKNQLIEK